MPLESRTRATLRRAEFGFLGVWVKTRVQTPRRWGAPRRAGVFALVVLLERPLRTSCWIVGNSKSSTCERGRTASGGTGPLHARRAGRPTLNPIGAPGESAKSTPERRGRGG